MEATRVEDFLNDKIQAFADFETLDSLLTSVQSQQALLKKQLEDAGRDLDDAESKSVACAKQARGKAESFASQQADIDRRLRIVTQSDSAEDAVAAFEPHMTKLHQLDVADQYLELLEEVERLRSQAATHQQTTPEVALAAYHQLYALGASLKPLQQAADGAAPHLLDHIDQVVASVRQELRNTYASELNKVLEKILWPKKSAAMPSSLVSDFQKACERLLTLQKPELERVADHQYATSTYQGLPVLLPLQVMVEPLAARFKFHFSGDRATNRIDKPEFFLNNFLEVLETHAPFISEYIQPVLFSNFRDSTLVNTASLLDAQAALINAMLPVLVAKVLALLPQVSEQPQHLSHLIHELMMFDTTLREDWRYDGSIGDNAAIWGGVCWEVLTSQGWFDRWITVEQDFALARYQTIMDDSNAMLLDYDSVSSSVTKPTAAATRVHDLITTITSTYKPLISLSQKLRFLMDVQIAMLDRFHDELRSSLQAFESKTSTISRTVQGVTAAELAELQGTSGLDRLCRIYGSADYLERAMRDWSDDVFFLDMWNQLQLRVQQSKGGNPVAGSLGVADIAAKTSASLAKGEEMEDLASGALFDETAGSYAALRERAETLIISTLRRGVTEAFRPYSRHAAFLTSTESSHEITPSSNLAATLSFLQSSFEFLSRALSPHALRKLSRSVARIVDDLVFDLIISKDFSEQGAKQLACDGTALSSVFLGFAPRPTATAVLQKTSEASRLLSLPSEGGESLSDEDEPAMSLREVNSRIFVSNDEARAVLKDLNLYFLNEGEARKVIKCRVEVAE